MNVVVKIILTIILLIAFFLFLGHRAYVPYFWGRILVFLGLAGLCIKGIIALWKKKNNEDENEE